MQRNRLQREIRLIELPLPARRDGLRRAQRLGALSTGR